MARPILTRTQKILLGLTLLYLAGWVALLPASLPVGAAFWSLVPVGVMVIVLAVLLGARFTTYGVLNEFLGGSRHCEVFDDQFPLYRYVDWFRALERYAARARQARRWDACHNEDLLYVLRTFTVERPRRPSRKKLYVGYEQHDFFPDDVFWMLLGPAGLDPDDRIIVRVFTPRMGWPPQARVEVACRQVEKARAVLKMLERDALAHSIYRGQFLEFRYTTSAHTEGEFQVEAPGVNVIFKARPNVTEADIILDDPTITILRRGVFDFFAHREQLHQLGLPRKRALLFYGPPGTGKTHTCRHVHTRLPGITSILVTGESLTHLQDIGKFARQLQPTLVIIEDVDLVFAAREVNPYGTALGELMDQLDGFTADEEVLFLLTTNAIERVEQAIRDRPGRINQCMYFGLPGPTLRRRYLQRYLQPYDIQGVDLDHLVRQTERTSQAFLKEYVLRAVQVAAESVGYRNGEPAPLPLQTAHFDTAFEELTDHGNRHSQAIMGFHTDRD
ncbi:MAG: ATP-binding protein [Gemmataceae bacterium]|nr:ATP-binding protein [Gemmataceae bacterium]